MNKYASNEVDILRKNVADLQKDLYHAYGRIRDLIEENIELKNELMLYSSDIKRATDEKTVD